MLNNCGEERPVWTDLSIMVDKLLAWHVAGGDSPDDDDESALANMLNRECRQAGVTGPGGE
jgi:hypothetical protein